MKLYDDLKWRGLIQDISSPKLEKKLNNGGLTFYIGTDPTADSLHLGHYSSFLITKRLANAGHTPLILVGGATGLVGDPRGTNERNLAVKEEVEKNFLKLKEQVQKNFPYEVVNNYDWVKDITIIDFLREYGKHINVNYMLNKDTVKRQLTTGLSYAEFSYMLIQGLDFKHLHETRGVDLQVAGSDQWGNITTGIELTRKTTGDEIYGLTMPLITDSRGVKFGKSEGNAVWLDKTKTSAYELYQFLLNSEDDMVIEYLKRLTFLSKEEIEQIEKEHLESPHLRIAQKKLASEITIDLHGQKEYDNVLKITNSLFTGDVKNLTSSEIEQSFKGVPTTQIDTNKNIVDLLVESDITVSKREAREFIKNNAITVNGDKILDENFEVTKNIAIDNKYIIIRKGKKKYYLIIFI